MAAEDPPITTSRMTMTNVKSARPLGTMRKQAMTPEQTAKAKERLCHSSSRVAPTRHPVRNIALARGVAAQPDADLVEACTMMAAARVAVGNRMSLQNRDMKDMIERIEKTNCDSNRVIPIR